MSSDARGGADNWEDLPDEIQDTFDKLGIPEAEKNALSGVGAQYESEIVYQNMQEQWEDKGVVFCDMDKAVQDHEEILKEYFMTKAVPPSDNKFAALHGAVWSGGSFVYVPTSSTRRSRTGRRTRTTSTRSEQSPRRTPRWSGSRAAWVRRQRCSTRRPS